MLKKTTKYKLLCFFSFLSVALVGSNVLAMDELEDLPPPPTISVSRCALIDAWHAHQQSTQRRSWWATVERVAPINETLAVRGKTYRLTGRIEGEAGEKFLSADPNDSIDFLRSSAYYLSEVWIYTISDTVFCPKGTSTQYNVFLELKPL